MTNDQKELTAIEHVSNKLTFRDIAQRHVSNMREDNATMQAITSNEVLNMEKIVLKQEVEKDKQNKLVQNKNEMIKNKIQLKNSSQSGGFAKKKMDIGNRWEQK